MDSLQQKPKTKVRLQCPAGHAIFPNGMIVGNLYKNHGVRLLLSQRVEQGYDFAKLESTMAKMRNQHGLVSIGKHWVNPDVNLRDCYRLTQQQMVAMGAKCEDCDANNGSDANNENVTNQKQSEHQGLPSTSHSETNESVK